MKLWTYTGDRPRKGLFALLLVATATAGSVAGQADPPPSGDARSVFSYYLKQNDGNVDAALLDARSHPQWANETFRKQVMDVAQSALEGAATSEPAGAPGADTRAVEEAKSAAAREATAVIRPTEGTAVTGSTDAAAVTAPTAPAAPAEKPAATYSGSRGSGGVGQVQAGAKRDRREKAPEAPAPAPTPAEAKKVVVEESRPVLQGVNEEETVEQRVVKRRESRDDDDDDDRRRKRRERRLRRQGRVEKRIVVKAPTGLGDRIEPPPPRKKKKKEDDDDDD